MQAAALLATQRLRLGIFGLLVVGALVAVLVELRAQPAPSDEALVLTADQKLGNAQRTGDRSVARRLLSLQFSFVDENGTVHDRRDFLADLKGMAAAVPTEPQVKRYGRIAMVTGHRHSAHDDDVFFLDLWAKQRGAWRALVMQDVVLAAADAPAAAAPAASAAPPAAPATPYTCKNPCQAIPYRVRSPAEQDIVNAFQSIEKAAVAHDADQWSKHIADEFVLYGTGRRPIAKSGRIATIERQKASDAAVTVGEVATMRMSVYVDGAAMTATHTVPDGSRPAYRAARVWVRRNGQWQMAISVQTNIDKPAKQAQASPQ